MAKGGPVILKFGGAALESPVLVSARTRSVLRTGKPVVLVVSARAGVTDLLLGILAHPKATSAHRRSLEAIRRKHPGLRDRGAAHLRRTARLIRQVERTYPKDRPLGDRLLSQGERLAAHWLSEELIRQGFRAVPVETDHLGLITDNAYGASCVQFDLSKPGVTRGLRRLLDQGCLPVVTGFFGRSLEGRVATLGRGGSDYSAASIGALIDASRIELTKPDVAVLTADPKDVPAARTLRRLSYGEAEELAQFGARVLHPLTIEPARSHAIELRVRSLSDPERTTTIGPPRPSSGIRALTRLEPLRLLRVRVPGGRQRPGVVAEISTRLAQAQVNLVALFTSSALLCLVLEPTQVRAGIRALSSMLAASTAVVDGPIPVALVTAIGDGILSDADRIPGTVLRSVEGFSATPRSLSLAVRSPHGRAALRAMHRVLVEGKSR